MKKTIDSEILKVFQKVSNWAQDMFGVTNFMIARVIYIVSAIAILIIFLVGLTVQGFSFGPIFFFVGMSYFLFGVHISLNHAENACRENPLFRNPYRVRFMQTRYILLLLFIWNAITSNIVFNLIKHTSNEDMFNLKIGVSIRYVIDLFLCLVYFASCTPKPYKPSKTKVLLQKTKESLRGVGLQNINPKPAFK